MDGNETFANQKRLDRERDSSYRGRTTSFYQFQLPGREARARSTTLDHRRGFSRRMTLSLSLRLCNPVSRSVATLSPLAKSMQLEAATKDELCIECTRACLSSFPFPASTAVFRVSPRFSAVVVSQSTSLRNNEKTAKEEKESSRTLSVRRETE